MYVEWIRLTLGFVFLLSFIAKLRSRDEFVRALSGYVWLMRRSRFRKIVSYGIPFLELLAATFLLMPSIPGVAGAVLAGGTLAGFTAAIAANVRAGVASACGCGIGHLRTGNLALVRNAVLIAGAGVIWAMPSPMMFGRLGAAEGALLYMLALLGSVLVVAVPNVLEELGLQLRSAP